MTKQSEFQGAVDISFRETEAMEADGAQARYLVWIKLWDSDSPSDF